MIAPALSWNSLTYCALASSYWLCSKALPIVVLSSFNSPSRAAQSSFPRPAGTAIAKGSPGSSKL